MPISNETFEYFRSKQKKIIKAEKLLKKNGFVVYKKPVKNK